MKLKMALVVVLLFAFMGGVFGQQRDETSAPEKVRELLKELREEIQKKRYSFSVGYNPALDYTIDQLAGLRETGEWWRIARDKNLFKLKPRKLRALEATVALPATWDWRDQNGVTSVKDQRDCGSCWAFGSIASFESFLLIKQDTTVDLSEQHLVSCNPNGWGCNGGWWPHDMFIDPGAVLERDFPYVAADTPCGGPYNYPFQISGWAYVDGEDKVPDTDKIKEAIYNYGPIAAAVYVGSAFQAYTGGVFDKDEATNGGLFSCCGEQPKVNHGIAMVGWDDSKQAWIIKNSWGSGWGESGYMYIKWGVSNIGYGAAVLY